jgi:hypothetical protein
MASIALPASSVGRRPAPSAIADGLRIAGVRRGLENEQRTVDAAHDDFSRTCGGPVPCGGWTTAGLGRSGSQQSERETVRDSPTR